VSSQPYILDNQRERHLRSLLSFPTRRSSDLNLPDDGPKILAANVVAAGLESKILPSLKLKVGPVAVGVTAVIAPESVQKLRDPRSEEHTSELQSRENLVCRLLLEKKK